jgi:hypothetical protein
MACRFERDGGREFQSGPEGHLPSHPTQSMNPQPFDHPRGLFERHSLFSNMFREIFSSSCPIVFFLVSAIFFLSPATVTCATPTPLGTFTKDNLLAIAPGTSSCQNAAYPKECATAADAAPLLDAAFKRYNLTTVQEAAAVLSWMLNESGEFKYNEYAFSVYMPTHHRYCRQGGSHSNPLSWRCLFIPQLYSATTKTIP